MRNIEFIVAGAGSGKTYTLTGRLTDAIRSGLRPDEVMLTTFTEMAAAEFREKARERLLKEGLTEQAATLDTAAIGTVHSVAFTYVKRYWYKLGMGPDPEVMPEEDARAVMDSALFHIVTQEDVEAFEQLHGQFNFQGMGNGHISAPDPEFWKKHLSSVIEKLQSYAITDLAESERHSLDVVDSFFNRDISFDKHMARYVLSTYCDSVQPTSVAAQARWDKARDLSTKKEFGLQELVDLLGINFTQAEKTATPGLDALLAHAGEALRGQHFGAPLKAYIQRIFRLAKEWQQFYGQYKLERGLMDYGDMESGFMRLLDMAELDEELREDISSRCKLVLVDEFQDSSPVQVKIFMRLSTLAEQSVWVGDIKQAIYGFRGTDSRLVNRVIGRIMAAGGTDGLRLGTPLSHSYRSRPQLVELVNTVFVRAFPAMKEEHVKLDATRNDAEDFCAAVPEALHHWHLTDGNVGNRAAALAQHLQQWLNGGGVSVYDKDNKRQRALRAGDITILCRGNSDCVRLAEVVRTLGMRAVISQEGADITDTAEFRVLHAMLRFALDVRSELPKAELLHLLAEMPLADIVQSKLDFSEQTETEEDADGKKVLWQDGHAFIERLTAIVQRLQGLPVPSLVEGLVLATGLRDEVCRWGHGDLRQEHIDLLVRQAAAYDERCERLGLGASLSGFISHISSLKSQKNKPVQHPDAIGIYTYHASKGLEWPVVILFDLNDDPLAESDMVRKSFFGVSDVSVSAEGDNLLPGRMVRLLPWFMGSKKTLPEDMTATVRDNAFYQQLMEDSGAEARRLLYVGMTRARDILVTTSHGARATLLWAERAGCPALTPAQCTDGERPDVFGSGKGHLFRILAADPDIAAPVAVAYRALKRPGPIVDASPRFLSPSSVGAHGQVSATATLLGRWEGRIATTSDSELSDAQFGDCLHHILCAFRTGDDDATALARVRRTLHNHLMAHVFPEPERIVTSIRQVYALLQQHYGPATSVGHEVPMAHRLGNGQRVRGTIDMLWHTEQGTVIIDLKTYQGGEQDVLNPQGHHFAGMHASQLLLYADALQAAGQQVRATVIAYLVGGMLVEVNTVADT
jgi:ATP-dependent helicase/nuclease subunit A